MSTQSLRIQLPKQLAGPQQPSTHTYRLSKFLKNRCTSSEKEILTNSTSTVNPNPNFIPPPDRTPRAPSTPAQTPGKHEERRIIDTPFDLSTPSPAHCEEQIECPEL